MNMSVPLYDAFSMEYVREYEQATVVSVNELAWQAGWTVGPFISQVSYWNKIATHPYL